MNDNYYSNLRENHYCGLSEKMKQVLSAIYELEQDYTIFLETAKDKFSEELTNSFGPVKYIFDIEIRENSSLEEIEDSLKNISYKLLDCVYEFKEIYIKDLYEKGNLIDFFNDNSWYWNDKFLNSKEMINYIFNEFIDSKFCNDDRISFLSNNIYNYKATDGKKILIID